MSDFNASVFILGIAGVSAIALFYFKKAVIGFISGFAWSALAIYQFGLVANSGDPDIGMTTYALAWVCIVAAIATFTAPLYLLKSLPTEKAPVDSKEQWEIDQEKHEKYVSRIRQRRPKKKSPWDIR